MFKAAVHSTTLSHTALPSTVFTRTEASETQALFFSTLGTLINIQPLKVRTVFYFMGWLQTGQLVRVLEGSQFPFTLVASIVNLAPPALFLGRRFRLFRLPFHSRCLSFDSFDWQLFSVWSDISDLARTHSRNHLSRSAKVAVLGSISTLFSPQQVFSVSGNFWTTHLRLPIAARSCL